jgi:1-phosphofructokinase
MNENVKIATVTLNPAIDQTVSIPNFQAGSVNRVTQSQSCAGGKGVNVASFLADYGCSVAATGFLGEHNIRIFEKLFTRKHIDDRFVRIAGSTRIGIKISDEVNQETTDINFPGQTPAEKDLESLFRIVKELTAECEWFVLAGSIPAGVPDNIYAELVTLIKSKNRKVALDTSGEGFRKALSMKPSLIKPNNHELEEFTGKQLATQDDVIEAAQNLLNQGIESVVVSMGADGALFLENDEKILAVPPNVSVVSTVGAGDAMVSGTVAGKILQKPLAECARLATAFSLSAVSQVELGLPDQEKFESFKQQVVINTL